MDPGHTEGGIGASWAQQVREVEEGVESIDGAGALGNDGDMADAEVFEQGRDEPQPGLNTVLCVVDGSSAAEAWAVESDEPDPVLFCEFILGDVEVATGKRVCQCLGQGARDVYGCRLTSRRAVHKRGRRCRGQARLDDESQNRSM